MKSCPEGAYTGGHVAMAVFFGLIVGIVIVAVMNDAGWLRDTPPDG